MWDDDENPVQIRSNRSPELTYDSRTLDSPVYETRLWPQTGYELELREFRIIKRTKACL